MTSNKPVTLNIVTGFFLIVLAAAIRLSVKSNSRIQMKAQMPYADRKCLRTVIKTFLEEQERFLSRINEVVCENKTLDGLHMDMVNCVEVPTDHAAVRVSHCRTIVAQHKLLRKHRLASEHCFLIAEREQSNQLSQEEILLELESMTLLLEKVRSEQARILRERDSILAEHSQVFKSSIKVLKER